MWQLLFMTLGLCKTPWTHPYWATTRYTGLRSKNSDAAPGQILDVNFYGRFPSTPDEFGLETSAIESILKLYFQPYKERPNLSMYVTWASVLVRAIPGVRN